MSDKINMVIGKQTMIYTALAVMFFTAGLSAKTILGGFESTPTVEVPSVPTVPSAPAPVAKGTVSVDDDPWIGGANAKVEIIEFSDFECPFCARAVPVVEQILDVYGNDVKIIFRNFPLGFHANAQKAAEAGECADEQGKFWAYHDILFENQNALSVTNLKRYAEDLGLNTASFDECLDSGKMASNVKKDFADGQSAGVSGTPTFFVNGIKVVGAQPFASFKSIIDAELGRV